MINWIRGLGHLIAQASETAGFGLALLCRTTSLLPEAFGRRRARAILDLLFQYTAAAFPVTAFVSVFTGMILALGFGISLANIGQEQILGMAVAVPKDDGTFGLIVPVLKNADMMPLGEMARQVNDLAARGRTFGSLPQNR